MLIDWLICHAYSATSLTIEKTIQKWWRNGTNIARTFDCKSENMQSLVRTKQSIAFDSGYNSPNIYRSLHKRVFKVKWAWHSPNTTFTTVHDILTWQYSSCHQEGIPYPPPGVVKSLCVIWALNHHQYLFIVQATFIICIIKIYHVIVLERFVM